jgi:hypothetical protein
MKQLYILLIACLFMTTVQAQNFTQSWKKLANLTDYTWFTNDNNVASIAFNPATNKLLVSKRNDRIFVVNPTTGAQEDTLKITGLGAESFKNNKIRVTSDGVIYGISLATVAGPTKIYRWASQTDVPVECASFTVTERCGDAFGLSGTGVNTVLYASGAGATNNAFSIYILNTTDGKAFATESKVVMTSAPTAGLQWANRAVEPDGTGVNAPLWINGGGFNARKITLSAKDAMGVRTGTVVTTIEDGTGSGQASVGYGGTRLFTTANNLKFLVLAGGNNALAGTKMTAINVTNEAAPITFGIDSLNTQANYVTNGNGTGDVTFKDNGNNSFTVFYVSTNNGIAATTSRIITPTKDLNGSNANGFTVETMENPAENDLKLQINATNARKMTVNVMNSLGSLLLSKQMEMSAGTNNLSLPIAQFASGLLLVTVSDGTQLQTVKFLKQ